MLDRLNPLLEPAGVLSMDERGIVDGTVPVLKPHPHFRWVFVRVCVCVIKGSLCFSALMTYRLFMSIDPAHGELSRPMRNRGIELFILPEVSLLRS